MSGTIISTRRPTSSTFMSRACAPRSTRDSTNRSCRPCAGLDTCSVQHNYWKLFRTSTFRLSALYLAVFILSVGAILAYVYWNTAVLLERQTDETIRAEIQGIAEQYRYRGLAGVADTVRRRSTEDSNSIYLLFTPEGKPVTGNLNAIPVQAVSSSAWRSPCTRCSTRSPA